MSFRLFIHQNIVENIEQLCIACSELYPEDPILETAAFKLLCPEDIQHRDQYRSKHGAQDIMFILCMYMMIYAYFCHLHLHSHLHLHCTKIYTIPTLYYTMLCYAILSSQNFLSWRRTTWKPFMRSGGRKHSKKCGWTKASIKCLIPVPSS